MGILVWIVPSISTSNSAFPAISPSFLNRIDIVISSPACHGPPSIEGELCPAPTNCADSISTKSLTLMVTAVLAKSVVQKSRPGLDCMPSDVLYF